MSRGRGAFLTASSTIGVLAWLFSCGPGSIGDLTAGRKDANSGNPPNDAATAVCEHAGAPERPATGTETTVDDLTFGLDDLRIDTGEFDAGLPKPLGLDLDKTCSCLEPPSCIAPNEVGAKACDGPDGRDNIVGPLMANVSVLSKELTPGFIYDRIHEGIFTVLFTVQKWNGEADDPNMVVSFRMALYIDAERDGGARVKPKFDGTDIWAVDPGSLVDGDLRVDQDCREVPCLGVATDFEAYMRGGVLVAHFASVPLVLNTGAGRVKLPFTDATLIGRIADDGGLRRITGELSGRFPTSQALLIATALVDPTTDKRVCASPGAYALFKKSVCDSADLAVNPANDHKEQPCDALSASLNFTGLPATIGHVRKRAAAPDDCPGFADTCR